MSRQKSNPLRQTAGPWPHRLAWVLACAVFLLVWVGGLVTTYTAGTAVEDGPATLGYWLYPPRPWLADRWDPFLEQGHRLLSQAVGLISVGLAVVLWKLDGRKWMRWLGAAAVAGVILQTVLGGLRVLYDEILLAKVHGCITPLFFGLCTALVALTSRPWRRRGKPKEHPAARRLQRLAAAAAAAIYVQIVLGAQLRHSPPDAGPGWFVLWVWLKLITAGLIAIGLVWLLIHAVRQWPEQAMILRRTILLVALFFVQLALGAGTWVTNYGWPKWFTRNFWSVEYTIVWEGPLQVWTTTAHAAIGPLNLVVALSLTLWSLRLLRGPPR